MRDDVQREHERHRHRDEAERGHRVAAHGVDHVAHVLLAGLAEEHRRRGRRREQDQLLAQRVEAAIVEDHRRDDVRDVPVGLRDSDEHVAVRTRIVAERGEAGEAPDEQQRQADSSGEEEPEANSPRQRFRLRCARPIAASRTTG